MRDQKHSFLILLVEDDLGDAGLVKIAVRRSNRRVEVHHVKDGTEAMAFLRGVGAGNPGGIVPDLILLDLNLPGRSGHEILEDIKMDPSLRVTPVVVLSTSDADRDVRRAYHLGANSFVTKPMDVEDFTKAIQQIMSYWFDTSILCMVVP